MGHVYLLQFWQMAVKCLVTKFVCFDSFLMELNVLFKQSLFVIVIIIKK